ncbi:hypothetical protein HDU97_005411 [Phlyctochytrium planicorne]|nr:hypothetical protein HDU97_005411 [Phlyctochytrium planicorne]
MKASTSSVIPLVLAAWFVLTETAIIVPSPGPSPTPTINCFPQTYGPLTKEPANSAASVYQEASDLYFFSTDAQISGNGLTCPIPKCLSRKAGDNFVFITDCTHVIDERAPVTGYQFNWKIYQIARGRFVEPKYAICIPNVPVNPEFNCIMNFNTSLSLAKMASPTLAELGLTSKIFQMTLLPTGVEEYALHYNKFPSYDDPHHVPDFDQCVKAPAPNSYTGIETEVRQDSLGCTRFEVYHA